VGKPLCAAIARAGDLQLVGAVSRTHQGQNLKDLTDDPGLDLTIRGSAAEALETPADVLVDYTQAGAVKANSLEAIRRGVHVVIGTSGLGEADFGEIHLAALARAVGVAAAGNFSITAMLVQRFACEAAKLLSHWEIIDYASDRKKDAPSGTARELAYRLAEVRLPEVTHPVQATVGPVESRGVTLNGSQVHSLRLPGYTIGVEVIFGAADERLTLRHDAGSGAAPYIQGTLLAVRRVSKIVGLLRGLDRIVDLE
jgi:4-hydroxy-tetrahydrodipicolinate reductase